MAEREQGPTLAELETVLGPDDNESAAETMRAIMEEFGAGAKAPGKDQESDDGLGKVEDVSGTGKRGADAPQGKVGRTAAERNRDRETGRFVAAGDRAAGDAKAGEVGALDADAAAGGGDDADAKEGAAAVEGKPGDEEEAGETEPPHEWTAEEQEAFRALPEASRKFMLERVNAARDVYIKAATLARRYEAIDNLIAPHRQSFEREGLDDVGALRQLLALQSFAGQRPDEFAQWFIQTRRLRPEQVFPELANAGNGADDGSSDMLTDPAVERLMRHNAELQARLDQIESGINGQVQQAREQQEAQLRAELQSFITEKDDKGRLKHPYVNEVRGLMARYMQPDQSGQVAASTLNDAYDMACRAHPGVSAKIAQAQRAEAERERARRDREKAAAARQAGSSITGTPADRARPEPTGDIREDMRREFAERGML